MAHKYTITGVIVSARLLRNSPNGNARFSVIIRDDYGHEAELVTEPDSSYTIDVQNALTPFWEPSKPTQRYRFHLTSSERWRAPRLGRMEPLGKGE